MAKIVKVRLTEYFPFQTGLTDREKQREGGPTDRADKPLFTLDDYLEGNAPYVSLACDSAGGSDRRQTSIGSRPATATSFVLPVKSSPVSTRRKSIMIGSITFLSTNLFATAETSGSQTRKP